MHLNVSFASEQQKYAIQWKIRICALGSKNDSTCRLNLLPMLIRHGKYLNLNDKTYLPKSNGSKIQTHNWFKLLAFFFRAKEPQWRAEGGPCCGSGASACRPGSKPFDARVQHLTCRRAEKCTSLLFFFFFFFSLEEGLPSFSKK